MNKFILILACLLAFSAGKAQSPVNDALKLAGFIEPGSDPPRFVIPGPAGDTTLAKEQMQKYCGIINAYYNMKFKTSKEVHQGVGMYRVAGAVNPDFNPFLAPFLSPGSVQSVRGSEGIGGGISSALSSIGGLDVTSIAEGLAKFLVKRTKEELNVAFFSRFKETLDDPRYRDLKTLFPATWELLEAIGVEIYDYNMYLNNLRAAFIYDLSALDQHLPGIIPNHQAFFDRNFELAVSLNSACYIAGALKSQLHPGEILDNYPMQFLRKGDSAQFFNRNWSGAIQTLQLVSGSLRDTINGENNYWVSAQKIKVLVSNPAAFRIYLGLVYQVAKGGRYDSIPFEQGTLIDLMNRVKTVDDLEAYKNFIQTFVFKVGTLSRMIRGQAKPAGDSLTLEHYARYFRSSVEILEYCTKISDLPHFQEVVKVNLPGLFGNYFKIAYATAGLASDINSRNYSSAVNQAVTIYNLVRTRPMENALLAFSPGGSDRLKSQPATGTPANDAAFLAEKAALEDSLQSSKNLLQKLARYGTFISAVAEAENSGEVEKAIEAAALPSGSSRIKRETPFNVALNAYTGLFIGYEQISGMKKGGFEINNYGLTAPVGVSISTGGHSFLCLFPKNEGHWSYTAFLSLIDIGAVASFRFQNSDSVAQVPTIYLKDIFSPGLFFSIGFPKCPLSLNLGAQVGPNLRKVYVEDVNNPGTYVNSYQDNVYWRFSASLVVDIPIFNFYTRSKN